MTYGWAILVVLAAIAALAYFGVLSPDKFLCNCKNVNLNYEDSKNIDGTQYYLCSRVRGVSYNRDTAEIVVKKDFSLYKCVNKELKEVR